MSDYLKIMPTTIVDDATLPIAVGVAGDALPRPAWLDVVADTHPGASIDADTAVTIIAAAASEIPPPITPRGYEYVEREVDGGYLFRRSEP